jgi:hypothetical protein
MWGAARSKLNLTTGFFPHTSFSRIVDACVRERAHVLVALKASLLSSAQSPLHRFVRMIDAVFFDGSAIRLAARFRSSTATFFSGPWYFLGLITARVHARELES